MIMTSEATHDATLTFFEEQERFGLPPENVKFMKQGMMPAVDGEGRLILAEKGRIASSPNGHGGALLALRDSGALDEMRSRGVDKIYYFQVDNPLVPVPDPVLLGYHGAAGAEMSSKVVAKTHPEEKVGIVAEVDGRTRVIEYSDLDPEAASLREADGRLRFRAGSIAVHVLERAFVERQTEQGLRLPFHVARKKVPYVDADGCPVEPRERNGIKFETFIFDALPEAETTVTQEVVRQDEFAPVKNATGADSPETARRLLSDLYGRWLRGGGADVPEDAEGHVRGNVEISPLFALDAEECARKTRDRGIRFRDGLVLTENDG
jgi:UDP-N-acetylglucosamine/UDP-N-acetylgalactosamine diphosphorylase